MKSAIYLLCAAALAAQVPAFAAGDFNSNHPEEAYPDDTPAVTSGGDFSDLNREVQQKLREAGFDAGPVNGDFNTKTQAALVQYQISQLLPASGALDKETLDALGVQGPSSAAGGTAPAQSEASAGQ
jgi:peptidoglycan hydrolase-like protein with peptidoglycan-binding domain